MSDVRRRDLERLARQGDAAALARWAAEQCRTGGEHLIDETTQRHLNRAAQLMITSDVVEGVQVVCSACRQQVTQLRRNECSQCRQPLLFSARQRGDGFCGRCHRRATGTLTRWERFEIGERLVCEPCTMGLHGGECPTPGCTCQDPLHEPIMVLPGPTVCVQCSAGYHERCDWPTCPCVHPSCVGVR